MNACTRVASIVACVLGLAAAEASDRQITISVDVLLPGGSPVEGLAVDAGDGSRYAVATTDESGRAMLVLDVPEKWPEVIVRPASGARLDVSDEQRLAARDKYIEIIDSVSISKFYAVELDPAESKYTLVIQTAPAIRVTGSVVDPVHGPLVAMINAGDRPSFVVQDPTEAPGFDIGGIEQGRPADLFFDVARPYIMRRSLTVQETMADVDLGAIEFQEPPEEGTLSLTTTADQDFVQSREGAGIENSVTLISSDAARIYNFEIGMDGEVARAFHSDNDHGKPRLAAGTYYVAPGLFIGNEVQLMLLRLIREGVPLDPHGVAKVVVPFGETGEIQFDREQAIQAIRAAAQ